MPIYNLEIKETLFLKEIVWRRINLDFKLEEQNNTIMIFFNAISEMVLR